MSPFTIVPDKSVDDVFLESMWDLFIRDNLNAGVVRPIAEVTLGVAAAAIDFTSIAADWSHLLLILAGRGDTASTAAGLIARFNADSGATYDRQFLDGMGASPAASEALAQTSMQIGAIPAGTAPASVFAGCFALIPHYAQATDHKFLTAFGGWKTANASGGLIARLSVGFWRSTAAINQVTVSPAAGNFVAGTKATLLGVGGI